MSKENKNTGGQAPVEEPKVASPADPKNEFRQLASQMVEASKSFHAKSDKTDAEIKAFEDRMEKFDDKMSEFELTVEKANRSQAATPETKGYQHTNEFKAALKSFCEGNKHGIHNRVQTKAGYHRELETKTDNLVRFDFEAAGALLMPAEISSDLIHNVQEDSAVMGLVTRSTTSAPQKIRTLRKSTPGIQWIAEEETTSKDKVKFRTVTLTPHKAAAKYGFSIEQFQDSAWDIVAEIMQAYREDFDIGVSKEIINGNGIKKPKGFLDAATEKELGDRTLLPAELIEMQESLLEVYQRSATWLFNRKTRAYIRAIVLGSDALQYLWEPDFTRRSPTLLLGSPVAIAADDHMHGVFSGNFDEASKPIVYGDFKRAYEVVMHTDMYIIDDIYTESSSFVRNINIMSRIDGQPLEASATLVALKKTA